MQPNVGQLEAQSLAQTQQLMRTIFAIVAYLRDLFPERCFEEETVAGMSLRRIRSRASKSSDRFVEWIEKGCFDALSKKYVPQSACILQLKTVVMVVSSGPAKETEKIVETYTVRISYPGSADHEEDRLSASLTLEQNDKQLGNVDRQGAFKASMSKMLRTLCINSQTLSPLPRTNSHLFLEHRRINMHLAYYEEVTPSDYEPPGFMPVIFDLENLFHEATSRLIYGTSLGSHHRYTGAPHYWRMTLSMETLAAAKDEGESNVAVKGVSSQQLTQVTECMAKVMSSENEPAKPLPDSRRAVKRKADNPSVPISAKGVRCMCGDYETDLGMIQCDGCKAWQHVVCAGYYSNVDKRLEDVGRQSCYYCSHGTCSQAVQAFLRDLCRMRRALSVMYGEGFASCTAMAKRLGTSIGQFSRLYKRLEAEGFVKRSLGGAAQKNAQYEVQKTLEAKAKIKRYFVLDLAAFEKFGQLMSLEKPAASRCEAVEASKRRRKQSTALSGALLCNAASED